MWREDPRGWGVSAVVFEEAFEFHQLRSTRDQLQDRLLRRRVGRQDDESAVHLPKNSRTAEGQDDLARHGDRSNPVLRFPAAGSGYGAGLQDAHSSVHGSGTGLL